MVTCIEGSADPSVCVTDEKAQEQTGFSDLPNSTGRKCGRSQNQGLPSRTLNPGPRQDQTSFFWVLQGGVDAPIPAPKQGTGQWPAAPW